MQLKRLRDKLNLPHQKSKIDHILEWLEKRRQSYKVRARLISLKSLSDWVVDQNMGIIHHKKGLSHFFSIQGVKVSGSKATEVSQWNQPILVQKMGGILAILCQEKENQIKFLLHAKYEPGNINKLQLAPTIQATQSNLERHHSGQKPKFSEYFDHPQAQVVYSARHNEEGARFWKKSNLNTLILLDPKENIILDSNDDYIWLTLSEIKELMLDDNIVNPYVKTILSPL